MDLYGRWSNANEIDFNKLPNSFVLKTNHGSGDIIIVKDKTYINEKDLRKRLNNALKTPFGYELGEYHYLPIIPCIIAEELLIPDDTTLSSSIIDYKIWCFNGAAYFIWACYNRTKDSVYVETHGLDWSYHPEKSVFNDHYRDGKGILPMPTCLDRMIEVANVLAQGFPEVRVDLYECRGKVYFGEMTFTSNAGYNDFFTQEFLDELGDMCSI